MANQLITFDEATQSFHLKNNSISYVMSVEEGNVLSHIYFGKKINHYSGFFKYPRLDRGFSGNLPNSLDRTYSKDTLPQEFSGNNTGDYRVPAVIIKSESGARTTDFRYVSYEIINGKPSIKGLPHSYVIDENEAQTLIIKMEDATLNATIELSYTIYANRSVIARHTTINNNSTAAFDIEKLASLQVDLPKQNMEVISLPGAHVRERQIERQLVKHGVTQFESRRGSSSHFMNPFIALANPNTTEFQGDVIGFQLVYSGNHQFTLERDYQDQTRVVIGINEYNFDWQLKPQEVFETPEVLMVYSDKGLNGMSDTYAKLLRERVARGRYQYAERPIVINNWEATYFEFDEKKIQGILDQAAPLGVEMFVLDDGWFGHRDDDNSSLGDWFEHANKLKGGLRDVANRVHDKKMKFGLWFEPEMISEESQLYREHPDYALQVPNRGKTPSRNQYVLDFSRQEIVNNIFNQMTKILDAVDIDYIKWDMNRNMSEVYSMAYAAEQQGEISHRYILGLYDLMNRLTTRYPKILFEGCSGGGGRFDAGVLYYMPQSWTSDNTDAFARLKIQYGTSLAFPISSMTAHVSAVPNHQTGRSTSLKMRGDVAMSGVFGYELNLGEMEDGEKSEVVNQITFYKKYRQLLQYGDFTRLKSPFESNYTAWQFTSPEKDIAILFRYTGLAEAQAEFTTTQMANLNPEMIYENVTTGVAYGGDELMNIGLYDTLQKGDFTSEVTILKAK